jgi:hypothetical protein
METYLDTDPDSRTFGTRFVLDEDGTTYTWAEYLARPDDAGDPDELIELVMDEAAPPPPTPATPRLAAAVARYVTSHRLLTTSQLLDMPEPDWFIERLIPKSPILVLHGDPGSRKTFLALDWAVCAEHGLQWHGKDISPGKVLYILGEGVQGLPKRLRALAHSKGLKPEDIKITWMAEPLNLFKITDEQVELWASFVQHFHFKYIVVDTLHKNMAGGEENSAKEVGQVFANAKKIAGDADLIFVHHDTKSKPGTRGSGSIDGDSDTVLRVKSTGDYTSNLSSDKVRDAQEIPGLELTFKEHEESDSIYLDTVGDPKPKLTHRLAILNFIRSAPGTYQASAVQCGVSSSGKSTGAIQEAWKSLIEEEAIYSEVRGNPKRGAHGQRTNIDVWFVNEDNVNLLEGTALSNGD